MAEMMPALTLWQPWASLIGMGWKPYEFRGWEAPHRYHLRRIGIHAGARPIRRPEIQDLLVRLANPRERWSVGLADTDEVMAFLERVLTAPRSLPLSVMVCTAELGRPRRSSTIFRGGVLDSDRTDHSNWAWPLSKIERLTPPEPAQGAQGFWPWAMPAHVVTEPVALLPLRAPSPAQLSSGDAAYAP